MKESLEIELSKDSNAFEVQDKLKRYQNLKVYAVTADRIRVYFNPQKIAAKKVLKLVRTNDKGAGKMKANVVSIRSIDPGMPAA